MKSGRDGGESEQEKKNAEEKYTPPSAWRRGRSEIRLLRWRIMQAGGGVVVEGRGGRRGRRLAILGDSVDTMGSQYITSPNPTPSSPLSLSFLCLFHLSGFPPLMPTSSVAVVSAEQHQRGSQMP